MHIVLFGKVLVFYFGRTTDALLDKHDCGVVVKEMVISLCFGN